MDVRGFRTATFLTGTLILLAAVQPLAAVEQSSSRSGELLAQEGAKESEESGDRSVRDFRLKVIGLLSQQKFSDLNTLADELRTQRLRFRGGSWQLHHFYAIVSSPGSSTATDAAWQAHIATFEQWIQSDSASPTPRVALAQTYLGFAWKARGNGFANTVTPEGWKLFGERVQSARTVLEQAKALTVTCPHWFLEMQTVALAQSWEHARFDALAEQALATEPEYYYVAVREATYLLPKWYGKPGDTEEYAGRVADRIGGEEGDAVYLLIASAVNCCSRTQAPKLSWPRIQNGFAAIGKLYGSTNHRRNVMAYLALSAGDEATAQNLFARIGNDWNKSVWKTKANYDASRSGQSVANTDKVTR
jgi:hypothetical protein